MKELKNKNKKKPYILMGAVQVHPGAMKNIPNFIQTGFGTQKLKV
jgi:hypothetical protein